jgi:hypothetical protein
MKALDLDIMQAIYVINLEYRVDRRIAMQKQLSAIGWNAEFFSAIRPNSAAGFPSIGLRGCFLSHLSVLKKARDQGASQVVVLEDDVNFARRFEERWKWSMAALEQLEWSIFYAGHPIAQLAQGFSRLSPDTSVLCTHFMVINGHALTTIIAGLETILSRPPGHPLGGPMSPDGAYSTLRKQNPSLVTYAYFPSLGYQRPSRTDIAELKWFDRVGALMPIVDIAREFKGKWRQLSDQK